MEILLGLFVVVMLAGPIAAGVWIISLAFRKSSLRELFCLMFFCAMIAAAWAATIAAGVKF